MARKIIGAIVGTTMNPQRVVERTTHHDDIKHLKNNSYITSEDSVKYKFGKDSVGIYIEEFTEVESQSIEGNP